MTCLKVYQKKIVNKKCLLSLFPKYFSNSSEDRGEGGSDDKDLKGASENDGNPSAPSMYDCRKYGHNLPCDSVAPYFEILPYIPTGIFRCTYGEMLGRGANKCGYYRNPEYFSYHHMTFYDMHLILRSCRQQSPKTGRKP